MTTPIQSLAHLSIATPCPADWDSMHGNDKVRYCQQCELHVYNISAMTKKQAEGLIASTEGRLCTRFYRRADGTILTKDCPIGLRAMRRRVSRVAGAAFGVVLSVFTSAAVRMPAQAGQAKDEDAKVKIKRTKVGSHDSRSRIAGTLFDINDAVIVNAKITLTNERTNQTQTEESSGDGTFQLFLEEGTYILVVEANGFATRKEKVKIGPDESLELQITLQVAVMGEVVFLPEK